MRACEWIAVEVFATLR